MSKLEIATAEVTVAAQFFENVSFHFLSRLIRSMTETI